MRWFLVCWAGLGACTPISDAARFEVSSHADFVTSQPVLSEDGLLLHWVNSADQSGALKSSYLPTDLRDGGAWRGSGALGAIEHAARFGEGWAMLGSEGLSLQHGSGARLARVEVPGGRVHAMVVRSDGALVALGPGGGIALSADGTVQGGVAREWEVGAALATADGGVLILDPEGTTATLVDEVFATLWEVALPGSAESEGAGVFIQSGPDALSYVNGEGDVVTLEAGDGSVRWTLEVPGGAKDLRAFNDGTVLVHANDGTLSTHRPSNGTLLNEVLPPETPVGPVALAAGGDLFFGCGVGLCRYGRDLTRRKRWSLSLSEEIDSGSEPWTAPVLWDSVAFWVRPRGASGRIRLERSWLPGKPDASFEGWPLPGGLPDGSRRGGWAL